MPTSDCGAELTTQHYRGEGYGHGPVLSDERVIFAVFEGTDREGNRIKPTAFNTKQLTRDEFSLARLAYTARQNFETQVVKPQTQTLGPLVGIACAQVGALRALDYPFDDELFRAVCVTDKVAPGDHDGHAALGFSESQQTLNISQKRKHTIRLQIQADLADTFGELIAISTIFGMSQD